LTAERDEFAKKAAIVDENEEKAAIYDHYYPVILAYEDLKKTKKAVNLPLPSPSR